MNVPPISRYPVPALADLPDDLREKIVAVQDKAGFVPNIFLALAHRPDEFRAFFAYHDALLLRASSLTKGEKEMIIVATSGVNRCLYCVVAHGAILRVVEKKPLLADQLATNPAKADLTPRQHAMIDFALKVCSRRRTWAKPTSPRCANTASTMKTSGTSAPSPRCSRCPTAWRT